MCVCVCHGEDLHRQVVTVASHYAMDSDCGEVYVVGIDNMGECRKHTVFHVKPL